MAMFVLHRLRRALRLAHKYGLFAVHALLAEDRGLHSTRWRLSLRSWSDIFFLEVGLHDDLHFLVQASTDLRRVGFLRLRFRLSLGWFGFG